MSWSRFLIAILLACSLAEGVVAAESKAKLNVVLILADDKYDSPTAEATNASEMADLCGD